MSTPPVPTHDVFLDIETDSLRWNANPWEIGMVIDGPGLNLRRDLLHVSKFRTDEADPKALELAGFYERHPGHHTGTWQEPNTDHEGNDVFYACMDEGDIAVMVEMSVRHGRVLCCNPTFDVSRLSIMLARNGYAWAAHYRPICVTTYAAGVAGMDPSSPNAEVGRAFGIERDQFGTAHTALADAQYAHALMRAAEAKAGVRPPWDVS